MHVFHSRKTPKSADFGIRSVGLGQTSRAAPIVARERSETVVPRSTIYEINREAGQTGRKTPAQPIHCTNKCTGMQHTFQATSTTRASALRSAPSALLCTAGTALAESPCWHEGPSQSLASPDAETFCAHRCVHAAERWSWHTLCLPCAQRGRHTAHRTHQDPTSWPSFVLPSAPLTLLCTTGTSRWDSPKGRPCIVKGMQNRNTCTQQP